MDQVKTTMANGFGAVIDIPGLNYRVPLYEEAYENFPQGLILGSETASTVSSRGVYKFPVVKLDWKKWDDLQCSLYDMVACSWSNLPDADFVLQDDKDWVIGEFVWTGFDYLGEGRFKAVCNGDATSLEMFHLPTMKAFSGKLVVLVQSSEKAGIMKLEVTGNGLKLAKVTITSK